MGLGNMLSIYWYGRAVAYWKSASFELEHSAWLHWNSRVHNTFLKYLPTQVALKTDKKLNNSKKNSFKRKLEALQIELNWKTHTRLSHSCSQLFAYYNSHFMQIIFNDTHQAIQKYFQKGSFIFQNQLFHTFRVKMVLLYFIFVFIYIILCIHI
ncbi:hypothetical protein RFI_03555 [Reticulomyxa filosa]|uniref:Uncharacterized protein n=1 Tax=Reticulomyxa filosa TaxID=46433 RepID=X6P601_RETFI|nr:hypothetical protein RFI_03555 [Reticulomyxa filosa]|eukprot:ETO33548.1 hypothetical protein RFI_03555 [Reticulomyxa filosa]